MLGIPSWIRDQMGESFTEVMAYPKIDLPMYEPLKDISIELLLPNINLIAENSITLIETNQRFVEAYMGGLNYEFAPQALWREYPTDQRGSYFRQFWDVGSYIDSEGLSEDALKEKLYDIPELHLWPLTSALGTHNNRAAAGQTGEQAVLVIRGELLKRYPNTMIYAQHARLADDRRPHRPHPAPVAGRAHARRGTQSAAVEDPQPAVRGEGRSGHLLLRLRPDRRRGRGRQRREPWR